MIRLVGPGGAGKTTIGTALAERLGFPFIDLDRQFTIAAGDISMYLAQHGYEAYACRNVQAYCDVLESCEKETVIALSSGFMTYSENVHPAFERSFGDIVSSPTTAALLPSLERELCVAETVRRQLTRPFSRPADVEEQVIRARFAFYAQLPVKKIETARSIDDVVEDLVTQFHLHACTPIV